MIFSKLSLRMFAGMSVAGFCPGGKGPHHQLANSWPRSRLGPRTEKTVQKDTSGTAVAAKGALLMNSTLAADVPGGKKPPQPVHSNYGRGNHQHALWKPVMQPNRHTACLAGFVTGY